MASEGVRVPRLDGRGLAEHLGVDVAGVEGVRARDDRAAEAGAIDHRIREVCSTQIRIAQVGDVQIGTAQISIGQLRARQLRVMKIRALEVCPGKVGVPQVGTLLVDALEVAAGAILGDAGDEIGALVGKGGLADRRARQNQGHTEAANRVHPVHLVKEGPSGPSLHDVVIWRPGWSRRPAYRRRSAGYRRPRRQRRFP